MSQVEGRNVLNNLFSDGGNRFEFPPISYGQGGRHHSRTRARSRGARARIVEAGTRGLEILGDIQPFLFLYLPRKKYIPFYLLKSKRGICAVFTYSKLPFRRGLVTDVSPM
jgi:hypothetical protein